MLPWLSWVICGVHLVFAAFSVVPVSCQNNLALFRQYDFMEIQMIYLALLAKF